MTDTLKRKRGRPSKKDVKNLLYAKALTESTTMEQAYLKTHPNSSSDSAKSNAWRMITPEVLAEVKALLKLDSIKTTKDTVEKLVFFVIMRWMKGNESTANYLRAIELLSKLCPEFKERQVIEDLSKKSEEEIDEEIKKLGIDPQRINLN